MASTLDAWASCTGRYGGHGIDADERPFHGELLLEPLAGEIGIAWHFWAAGIDGAAYHHAQGWIAPDEEGRIALWCTTAAGIRRHELRNGAPAEGVLATLVFGTGHPADSTHDRTEHIFERWADGTVGYRMGAGLAGEPFLVRWSVRMRPDATEG